MLDCFLKALKTDQYAAKVCFSIAGVFSTLERPAGGWNRPILRVIREEPSTSAPPGRSLPFPPQRPSPPAFFPQKVGRHRLTVPYIHSFQGAQILWSQGLCSVLPGGDQ